MHNNVGSLDRKLWLHDDQRFGRKEPNMMLIGVDYHPSFQTIAFLIEETGEYEERELKHSDGQAELILSRPEAARNLRAGRNGGYRTFTLVRAATC